MTNLVQKLCYDDTLIFTETKETFITICKDIINMMYWHDCGIILGYKDTHREQGELSGVQIEAALRLYEWYWNNLQETMQNDDLLKKQIPEFKGDKLTFPLYAKYTIPFRRNKTQYFASGKDEICWRPFGERGIFSAKYLLIGSHYDFDGLIHLMDYDDAVKCTSTKYRVKPNYGELLIYPEGIYPANSLSGVKAQINECRKNPRLAASYVDPAKVKNEWIYQMLLKYQVYCDPDKSIEKELIKNYGCIPPKGNGYIYLLRESWENTHLVNGYCPCINNEDHASSASNASHASSASGIKVNHIKYDEERRYTARIGKHLLSGTAITINEAIRNYNEALKMGYREPDIVQNGVFCTAGHWRMNIDLVRKYCPKNGLYHAQFAGWGTTPIWCNNEKINYVGYDINDAFVIWWNKKIKPLLPENDVYIEFRLCDSRNINPALIDKVDFIYDSPPYLNFEAGCYKDYDKLFDYDIYAADDFDNWLQSFMLPIAKNAFLYLKKGAYLLWQTENETKKLKKWQDIGEQAGFEFIEQTTSQKKGEHDHATRHTQTISIFRKPAPF